MDKELSRKINLVRIIDDKNIDFETFSYSDYAYNLTSEDIDEIWDLYCEMRNIGYIEFDEKYKND